MTIAAVCFSDEQLAQLNQIAKEHHNGNVSVAIRDALAAKYPSFKQAQQVREYATGRTVKRKPPK